MQTPAPDLSQLKDIHLPGSITDLPIAFGWWILLVVFILLIVAVISYALKRREKNKTNKAALLLLSQQYEQLKKHKDTQLFLQQSNQILKRYCLDKYPEAASLSGDSWTNFLNRHSSKNVFEADLEKAISQGLYQSQCKYDTQALYGACVSWIKNNKESSND
jgi:cbb3-type cytochrome oxidase subunit 3